LETPLPLKISITGSDANSNFVNDLATKLKKVGNSMDKSGIERPQPFGPFPSGQLDPPILE
jgi:hypothetical protein